MVNVSRSQRAVRRAMPQCRVTGAKFAASKFLEYFVLWFIGGAAYVCIELLWRGRSHWTMFVLGGLCEVLVGLLNEGLFPKNFGIIPQALMGGIIITLLEFATGCIVNIGLGWSVWDYSNVPGNIMGQICPQFAIYWVLLSVVIIFVDDRIRYKLFGEPKPQYKLWLVHDDKADLNLIE